MKILLLGDASNYHRTLAGGLRKLGHDVTVASDGSRWMQTDRDIDLTRRPGKLGGALLWLKLRWLLSRRLKGYDVVQITGPHFAQLKPKRLHALIKWLKQNNRAVYLTDLGTDTAYIECCLSQRFPLRYSEYRVAGAPTAYSKSPEAELDRWLTPAMHDYCYWAYRHVDGVVTALHEYHLVARTLFPELKIAYAGIPIDTDAIVPRTHGDGPVNVVLAAHSYRMVEKGADRLLALGQRLQREHPERVRFRFLHDLPYDEFKQQLDTADVLIDQLYSYTPATSALMAMAGGKVVVSGGEPEYYRFIGENNLHPIINADPTDLEATYRQLEAVVMSDQALAERSRMGREFVERHNSDVVVARRFLDFWQECDKNRPDLLSKE